MIHAYIFLLKGDQYIKSYRKLMELMIKKNIFTEKEYILPNSSSDWLSQSKIILRKKY